ncbi:hypothetical protein M5689_010487 [Euphorbia peplus]|nr:hypothetical protein M5689_010487 [Euphorbia peplus]
MFWYHVRVIHKSQKRKGGNLKFQCKICNNEYSGSLYRIKAHMLKLPGRGVAVCLEIKKQMFENLAGEVAQDEAMIKGNLLSSTTQRGSTQVASRDIGSTIGSSSFSVQGVDLFDQRKRKADIKSPLEKLANDERVEQLHTEIARMFYTGGLFHLARNPYYVSSYTMAANQNIISYLPPGYNTLPTTLLQKERENIERLLLPT